MSVCEQNSGYGNPLEVGANIYRNLVESATDYAMITTSLDGRITTWSAGATRLLGYSPDEIVGQNLSVIFTFDDQLRGVHLSEMRTALTHGRAEDDRWHVRKDGSRLWASGLLTPLRDDSGQVAGFIKILRDRTEAVEEDEAVRANEERLRFILKSAADYAIFTFDYDGRLLSWNSGACRIMGYEEAEILGRDARVLFTPEEQEKRALEWEMTTADREGRAENERFHVRKDGSRFWGSGLTMPLKVHRRKAGYLKIMRDDTQRHQAEEHQQVMMREMSHRVKNSLMLVTGMLAMQARSTKFPELKRSLLDAETRVATIAAVHDHLWRQSNLDTVDLAEFLRGLCDRLAQTSCNHTVVFEASACSIDADRAIQLALLVNELVTNAFKHAYAAGGKVDVGVRETDQRIVLSVCDQGVGFPDGFDWQQGSSNSLGMRIINGLCKQLKAEMSVETEMPGVCFTLSMPLPD
jgi:PAS domain S-box-containing protein